MDFIYMPINEILQDEITKLNSTFLPPGIDGDRWRLRAIQTCLTMAIDRLGELSAAAQGLSLSITQTKRLRDTNTTIYLLKDAEAESGKGSVIGMLRVARKHLFLFNDELKKFCEMDPMCVLDFYVQPQYQRHGRGLQLFEYMLQDLNISPHQLAVDQPSPKMAAFLKKHYAISELIKQNNNFAISPDFFGQIKLQASNGPGEKAPAVQAAASSSSEGHSVSEIIHGSLPTFTQKPRSNFHRSKLNFH